MLSNKELDDLLDKVIYLNDNPSEDEDDWLKEMNFMKNTIEMCFADYIKTLQAYFIYLNRAELMEYYEVAAKLMKVIDIEEKNFIQMCKYSSWYTDDVKQDALAIKTNFLKTFK